MNGGPSRKFHNLSVGRFSTDFSNVLFSFQNERISSSISGIFKFGCAGLNMRVIIANWERLRVRKGGSHSNNQE